MFTGGNFTESVADGSRSVPDHGTTGRGRGERGTRGRYPAIRAPQPRRRLRAAQLRTSHQSRHLLQGVPVPRYDGQ